MSIICINRLLRLMLIALLSQACFAGTQQSDSAATGRDFSFTVEAMGGVNFNQNEDNFKSNRLHVSPSLRFLWKPDHRLNVGIEATYLVVRNTEFVKNKNKISGKMEAIPIFLLFNMKALYLEFTAGLGVSYISSTINVLKEESKTTNWHYCFNFGLGYTIDVLDNFGIGLEAKVFTLTKTDERIGSVYLKFVYNFLY